MRIPRAVVRRVRFAARSARELLDLYRRNPPAFNERLNEWERARGRTRLWSYPRQVGINISNVCNQQCLFCSLEARNVKDRNWLTADLFERMTWLRFVWDISLFAGSGEPLVNPQFPQIVRTVRRIAPRSRISTFTNGLALAGENLAAIVENFDSLHVSLNAARECTYSELIRGGSFDRVMRNLRELGARKGPSLAVELSMVLTRQTAADVRPMVDLAAECGFRRVIVVHYCPTDTTTGNRLAAGQSAKPDAAIVEGTRALGAYARERNVEFCFSESLHAPTACSQPWTSAYITNDDTGSRILAVCCSGIVSNMYVGESVYVDFKKAWNCGRLQEIRRTANAAACEQNNMCWLCKQIDKSDPDWKQQLHALAGQRPTIGFNHYDEAVAFPRRWVA
jgi:MoaA/NifB/PqqE/SkfB family radical SAM enzyme